MASVIAAWRLSYPWCAHEVIVLASNDANSWLKFIVAYALLLTQAANRQATKQVKSRKLINPLMRNCITVFHAVKGNDS